MSKVRYQFKLKVPIYGWDLIVYRLKTEGTSHKIPDLLNELLPDEMKSDFQSSLDSGGVFGFCYRNDFFRQAHLVICAEDFTGGDYVNKLTHEVNHFIDTVMETAQIYDTEARSYFTGWIYQQFREHGLI